jgi:hypothetical protein
MNDNRIIFIATSKSYLTEFLNAFAYPNGHHVFFHYRALWIADHERSKLFTIVNSRAILIFCEQKPAEDDFRFHPIRYCQVLSADIPDSTRELLDNDQVVLRLKLGEFVHSDLLTGGGLHSALHELIAGSDYRPYPLDTEKTSSRFVFSRMAPKTLDLSSKGEWHRAALALRGTPLFKSASLMHVGQLREIRSKAWYRGESLKPVEAVSRPYGLIYQLRFDRSYMLGLEYLLGDERPLARPEVAPPAISISMPFRRPLSDFARADVILSPLGAHDSRCGVQIPGTTGASEPLSNVPRALLMLDIRGQQQRPLLYTAIIGAGLVLQTFSGSLEPWASHMLGLPAADAGMVEGLIKATGLLLSLVGVLFGFRHLPHLAAG